MRVDRWTEVNPLEEPELDLDGALRNSEMSEHPSSLSGLVTITEMIYAMRKERLHPVCWATGLQQEDLLARWVDTPAIVVTSSYDEIYGIPIHRLQSLPEDTLILCGAAYKDADIKDIKTTVKTAIELAGDLNGHPSRSAHHSSGAGPAERPPAARTLETPVAGNGSVRGGWEPGRFLVSRVGGGGLRPGASAPHSRGEHDDS